MNDYLQIGFSQRIQLDWLELTAALSIEGRTPGEIQDALQELLREQLSVGGTAERGNREKAITILLKTWVSVSKGLAPLRDDGLRRLERLPAVDHMAVHWGMSMAAYPFFGLVAQTVGRLLALQGTAGAAQVQRRVREQLGERETVARAARRVLRTYIDWGVLTETAEKGVYQAAPKRIVEYRELAAWLIEAALVSSGSTSAPLKTIVQAAALFPFTIEQPSGLQLESNIRLDVFRQGLDQDMVMLASDEWRVTSGEL